MADLPTLADAKAWLHIVDDTSQDADITRLLAAAARRVETFTGVVLLAREIEQRFDTFGVALELNRGPVSAVESIIYADADGVEQELADYLPALGRVPPRIYPERDGWWPALDEFGQVVVTYTAGYAAGEAPEDLIEAVLRLVAFWFVNREAGTRALPDDVRDLCMNYRRVLA